MVGLSVSMNAGIIPFAVAPTNAREIYLLLGQEEEVPNWQHGSNKWCGFSGRSIDRDNGFPARAAAREFVEETMGVVRSRFGMSQNLFGRACNDAQLSESLNGGEYICSLHTNRKSDTRQYQSVTFLKQIPWDPRIPARFAEVRAALSKLNHACIEYTKCAKEWQNRHGLFGVPLPGKLQAITHSRSSSSINEEVLRTWIDEGCEPSMLVSQIATINVDTGKVDKVRCVSHTNMCSADMQHAARTLAAWQHVLNLYINLPEYLHMHPAINVQYVDGFPIPIYVKVGRSYLEKQRLRWWSLPRLQEVLDHGGHFRGDAFRHRFLPSLAITVSLLNNSLDDPKQNSFDVWRRKTHHDTANEQAQRREARVWRSQSAPVKIEEEEDGHKTEDPQKDNTLKMCKYSRRSRVRVRLTGWCKVPSHLKHSPVSRSNSANSSSVGYHNQHRKQIRRLDGIATSHHAQDQNGNVHSESNG